MSKVITDPVHGSIRLDAAAVGIMETRELQRLRRIKQLGLVSMVFPSADFSRFAHSCGVYHIASLMVAAVEDNLSKWERETIKLAALLHDAGHYPFSHTTEIAMMQHYPEIATPLHVPRDEGEEPERRDEHAEGEPQPMPPAAKPNRGYMKHEEVGALLVHRSPAIRAAIPREIDPGDVANLITGKESKFFAGIVKSDLDADRLDYLLRDGYFSGLPFGKVDLEYLVSQMRVAYHNDAKRLGFRSRAINAVDHMLMARYFAYQQLVWHKTAAAFEWLLVDVLKELMQVEDDDLRLDFSRDGVVDLINTGRWTEVDDGYILARVSDLGARSEGVLREKADAILNRRPPRTIPACEGFIGLGVAKRRADSWGERTAALLNDLETNADLPRDRVRCWDVSFKFVDYLGNAPTPKQERESVVMIRETDTAYLQTDRHSLMHALSKKRYRIERVYVLPSPALNDRSLSLLLDDVMQRTRKHLMA